jgi:drug/metabolite transporter (DMT)-like permease
MSDTQYQVALGARSTTGRTVGLTTLAVFAFAANSVLCRIALREGTIDAASFSVVRVLAGAAMLLIITRPGRREVFAQGSWRAAAVLAVYALPFAFAYTQLTAGTGALIMFGSVQITMIGASLASGERHTVTRWVGAATALLGLVILVLPGLTAPSPHSAALMTIAGVCWGAYSLLGRTTRDALSHTTGNFVRTSPLVTLAALLFVRGAHAEPVGIALAATSGAVTSGLGYVVWYAAVRQLSAMHAAIVQLAVPVLAAAAGVLLLSEAMSLRLVVSAILVLGGIAVAIAGGPQSVEPADARPTASPR